MRFINVLFLTGFITEIMKKLLILSSISIAMIGLLMTSCDNDPGPGTAEVKVIDEDGVSQPNVLVRMYCTMPDCVVDRQGRTNSLGVYSQEFELPVVLRVRAVRYDTTRTVTGLPPNQIVNIRVDSLCGEGFVNVENDEVVNETITILECN